jgi:CHAT domain-containing protein
MHWCPTGSFSFLPLHAAGEYDRIGQSCPDYVVSSYTPTLEALLTSRRDIPAIKRNETNGLLVVEPLSPGMPKLSGLGMEAKIFQESFPPNSVRIIGDPQRQPNEKGAMVLDVLEELQKASLVHLACHGHQNVKEPLESGFYLSDGTLTVRQLMRLNMPRAFFAFLSACETAKGDQAQADQNLHLAATMLFVGYRSILGTMWYVSSLFGGYVAEA